MQARKIFRVSAYAASILSVAAIELAVHAAAPAVGGAGDRSPVPTTQAAQEAEKLVKDVYKDEYAKRGPEERRALAQKLLEDGRNNKSDPASQYVLLREARDAAASVGDVQTAIDAAVELGKTFQVDPVDTKLGALTAVRTAARTPEAQSEAAEATAALIDEAAAVDNFDAATRAADLAIGFATASKNMTVVTEVQARKAEVKAQSTAYLAMKVATEKLKKTPTDPQSNFEVGSYQALYKNDWDKGLPMIAAGNDPAFAAAAKADLAAPVEAAAMAKVGDQWWDLATARPQMKTRLLARSEFWYNLVVPNADGLLLAKVQKRLDQIAASKPGGSFGVVSEATRKLLPTNTEIKHLKDLYGRRTTDANAYSELQQLKQTLMYRLHQQATSTTEADFIARCKADAQLRKVSAEFNDINSWNYGPLISSFETFLSTSKSKDEYAARLTAIERFNNQDKATDPNTFDNSVYSSIRNYVSRNLSQFPNQAARLQFCAFLKTKGLKSNGLERYRSYVERSRSSF
jgi:hypothetical protein